MADGCTFEVPNQAEWMAELMRLPQVMQERVVRGAVATGASVIRKEVIVRAPEWTGSVAAKHPPPGTLKKAIYQFRTLAECTPTVEVFTVAVRTGKANARGTANKYDAYYARWVEYGHFSPTPRGAGTQKARRAAARAAGQATWVAARPFFRPAYDAKKAEALQAMQHYINQNLPLAAASFRYIKAIS